LQGNYRIPGYLHLLIFLIKSRTSMA
jgi:hypothetical protein